MVLRSSARNFWLMFFGVNQTLLWPLMTWSGCSIRGEMESKPDPQEIEKVLTLLSSPLILAVSQKGKNYFSLESANVTALRLESLAQALRQVSMMLE